MFGFFPYRRAKGSRTAPHLSLKFRETEFHIDTSKSEEGFNVITHAHSDHYGLRNISNPSAIASIETSMILQEIAGKKFQGTTFRIGEKFEMGGVKISTHGTEHMYGSSAFLFKSESRVLVTGDVKEYSHLPECDVLVCEATYGNPDHIFEEEIQRVIEEANNSSYGVYPVGKAQRIGRILQESGIPFTADEKISRLCRLFGIETSEDGYVHLTSTKNIYGIKGRKFILTAQKFYRLPRIVVSDHLDYRGIIGMINHCNPEAVIFYHGRPSLELLKETKNMGIYTVTLSGLDRVQTGNSG